MKKIYKTALTLVSGLVLGVFSVSAYTPESGEAVFSYNPEPDVEFGAFGVGDGDGHFDVAIKLESSAFKGNKIKGVLVPFGDTDFLIDMSAWVSYGLYTSNGNECRHTPDICEKKFFFSNPNEDKSKPAYAEVIFDQPVEIGDKDLYVGYTFWIADHNEGNNQPILVYPKSGYEGKSLFAQTEHWQFKDVVSYGGYRWSSSLQVIMEAPEAGVSVLPLDVVYTSLETDTDVSLSIMRVGEEKVTSLEYDVEVDGQTSTYTYKVPDGAVTSLNSDVLTYPAYSFPVTIPKFYEKGQHNMRITVTKVNGKTNGATNKAVNTKVRVSEFIPVKRPLVEEATCTACTYCTRGIYAMKVMERLHGDEFVGIAYHNSLQWGGAGEPMHVLKDAPFSMAGGNPALFVDRKLNTEDFYNTYIKTTISVGVDEAWQVRKEQTAPAALDVVAEWKDDSKEELIVKGTAKFTAEYENAGFKMDLVLLHDGMHGNGPYWTQRNYYSGIKTFSSEPEWDEICNAKSSIEGMHFQDVYVGSASGTALGVENSVPDKVNEESPVEITHTFVMNDMKNLTGGKMIQNKNALRVVVVLIDKDGAVLNAAKNKVPGYNYTVPSTSGISGIDADAVREVVGYYDLNGRKVLNPETGVYIVKYSDGVAEKVILKK